MRRFGLFLAAAVAAVALTGHRDRSAAQDKAAPATAAQPDAKADGPEAEVRALGKAYTTAFNAGDAKAVAAFWTEDGEYTDPDGETTRGRAAIEKSLADQFKAQPKATVEVKVDAVRVFGRATVVADGSMTARVPGVADPAVTRFSALFVREDGGWKVASVREWEPDPATDVTLADVEWLVGEWAAKGPGGEVSIHYEWDATKTFINGRYTVTKDGKVAASGTQVIGRNPAGGLRSWLFDGSGPTGDSEWTRDGSRWLVEAAGTRPDGSEMTAVYVLMPLGADAFTWQSTQRTAGGAALPDQPPVKVTRVKK